MVKFISALFALEGVAAEAKPGALGHRYGDFGGL